MLKYIHLTLVVSAHRCLADLNRQDEI